MAPDVNPTKIFVVNGFVIKNTQNTFTCNKHANLVNKYATK